MMIVIHVLTRILSCFVCRVIYTHALSLQVSVILSRNILHHLIVARSEFVAELYDFLNEEITKWYPEVKNDIRVTLLEAGPHILGSFDQKLREYTSALFRRRNIDLRTGTSVTKVTSSRYLYNVHRISIP